MKQLLLFVLLTFFFVSCDSSSDDEKQTPPSLPNISELALNFPTNSPDQLSEYASVSGLGISTFAAFSQLPDGTFEDGIWTWEYSYNGLTMTATSEVQESGDYLWKFYLDGVDDNLSQTFNNQLIMQGTISKDGTSGSIDIFFSVDGFSSSISTTWSTNGEGAFTSTTSISSINGDQEVIRTSYTFVQNQDGSGSFTAAVGTIVLYSATWDSNGIVTETGNIS